MPKQILQGCRATALSTWENKPEWGPDKALDGDSRTCWNAGVGSKQGRLELDLGRLKRFDSAVIEEGWGRVQRFELQVKDNDHWRTVLEENTIGPYFNRQFSPVSVRQVRLNIVDARDLPTIWEFQLFRRAGSGR